MSVVTFPHALEAVRAAAAAFDADTLDVDECAALVRQCAAAEKAVAAARVRVAARAARLAAHRRDGCADPADWLARQTGSSTGAARAALATTEALGTSCPATAAALREGAISHDQAREIARTESEAPGNEAELLALARRASLGRLCDEGRRIRQAAADPDELHRRQQAARTFRKWTDELGMIRFTGALPPEVGVAFANRLDADTDRLHAAARRSGSDEPREAHAADAFAAMVAGGGRGHHRKADLVIVIDLRAYRRGRAAAGEVCHLIGGGPVPVDVAKAIAADAFVKAVVHDGVDVREVRHFGRHLPAELRTALELGPPPHFPGVECADGCGRRHGLEWDHVDPVANFGPTAIDNLEPRCWPHHVEKTRRDGEAGLLGPRWKPREETRRAGGAGPAGRAGRAGRAGPAP